MREKILEILEDVRPDIDFETEKTLIDDGILESFDIITIVAELNDAFDIEISLKALKPVNFNSIEGLTALVEKLSGE